ncbi:RNA polymerase sigma factor [Lapillicoccus jejuensis]|uniref:RNA polymerase sigma factor (Sigma-70 family) n=1 Tax=Lapillicoccus jejuensis TaxID=402171 RepID=A0A542DXN6_9MICO|nr:sigma-70 family RNA polymerase sigma factor [Lapillicoccus jejuensis]TQJ07848.1 RNA polymerase sigma factor (sigma-70 family) [Lapillicoccus jejuensis]
MQAPFERAVQAHGARVLRVVGAVLGPGADAEDAWSETFLSALRAWPDLPEDADVAGWLVTIAHRKAVDVVRASARRGTVVAEPPEPGRRTAAVGAPAAGSTAHVDALDLVAAVAALPPRQREAVAYHHLAGLPHPQVARLTGRSAAAVRRSAADGVAALRRAGLDPEEPA